MNNYLKRTRVIFAILVLATLLLTIHGIFIPMEREIEMNLLNNFNLLSETKKNAFMSAIDRSIQGAKSLSSRTVIRNKIVEYLQGEVSFEELQKFTSDKYLDGVRAIDDVVYSVRVVENKVVIGFYTDPNIAVTINDTNFDDQVAYELFVENDNVRLEVISPIFYNHQVIGYDLLGCDMNDIIKQLNIADVKLAVTENELEVESIETHENLYEDETNIYYVSAVDDDFEIVVSQPKDKLFENRNDLTRRSVVNIVVGYLFILLIVYVFIINYSKKVIKDLSLDRDLYKNHADKDTLTSANTRLYFNDFVEKHPFESGLLILIDLNDFKEINDVYGHSTGDDVLKMVVSVFKNSIRDDDLVIRYGGDEFLLFLRTTEYNDGTETIKSIKRGISNSQYTELGIEFSYGISFVESLSEIDKNIKEADEIMYKYKEKSVSADLKRRIK